MSCLFRLPSALVVDSRFRLSLREPLSHRPLTAHQHCRTGIATEAARDTFEEFLLQTQDTLISETETLDGSTHKFLRDKWQRGNFSESAGYGITAVLEGGSLLEKAAINVSIVAGKLSSERAKAMSSRGRNVDADGGQEYSAAALSLVFHPTHPYVPTLRADVRRFKVGDECWFGGGCDLTPCYLFEDDAREFHAFWKHGPARELYPKLKHWCDQYFYIPARQEHRGIGGIFFDDLSVTDPEPQDIEQFVRGVAEGFLPSWEPIAIRRRQMRFAQEQRDWQLLRRGRYIEFNLLYDRGVKFGLGGRIESVMVSAPPLIAYKYNVIPKPGSPEAALVEVLQQPREWA